VFVDLFGVVRLGVDVDKFVVGVELPGEAGFIALVADARANGFGKDDQGVKVAIGADLFDDQEVAGRFALEPQLLAGTGIEAGFAGFEGFGKGFFVHETDHEDAMGLPVLYDGGDEAIEFRVVEFWYRHNESLNRKPAGLRFSAAG